MPKITINLWFDKEAEDAAKFYTSLFPNATITNTAYYPDAGQEVTGMPAGSVMTVAFNLDGQEFIALNGGKQDWSFNDSTSFIINCDTQEEVDNYWDGLTADGGQEVQCGWLKDKFGVSWQVIPHQLNDLLSTDDEEANKRVMNAMLQMKKIVIADLEAAAKG